jgi:hypothetical protein
MIDRQNGRIVIECDGCGEVHEGETNDWLEEWRVAKAAGWRTCKIGSDWIHTCPECEEP